MTARAHKAIEPRLLSTEQAASYCGLSAPTFQAECPVIPIRIRSRVLYDRAQIDRWVDSLARDEPKSASGKNWPRLLDDDRAPQGN